MLDLTFNKVHDESRQGEAYAPVELKDTGKKFYIESYGCQMNFSDSEIVASILQESGYGGTNRSPQAHSFERSQEKKSGCTDRCTGLYGRTTEIKTTRRRETG